MTATVNVHGVKVTTTADLDALPIGAVVMDGDGGLYRKRATSVPDEWLDIDTSVRGGEQSFAEAATILWQTIEPHAYVLYSGPIDRTVTARCVYGKCGGASHSSVERAELDAWMDRHVAERPHSSRWPATFALAYAASPGNPGVAYRDAVMIDQ